MAWYRIAENVLDAIANAINAKTGGTSPMTPVEMVLEIQSIQTGGGQDLTPFDAIAGEVTPIADSTSLGFPTGGKFANVTDVIFFLAYVDDYTQFVDQNNMIVGSYKANSQFKIPNGATAAKTIQVIDTSRTPPLNYWSSATTENISGNNYVISNTRESYFKAGVKYTYIIVGVSA